MQPSEMTNEELAKALMSRVPLDSNNHDDIREASARLRTFAVREMAHRASVEAYRREVKDLNSKRHATICDLRRRLKAAEKFAAEMKESTNSLVRACGHQMILRLQGEGGNDAH